MATEHYRGGCHCGAVRFEVDLDLASTITCNCSRCRRLGIVLAFAPRAAFTLQSGEASLTEYRFNKRVIRHLFCSTCGIESFAHGTGPDGGEVAAVNVNCLDDVDPAELHSHAYDGRSA